MDLPPELMHKIAFDSGLAFHDVSALASTCSRICSQLRGDAYSRARHSSLRGLIDAVARWHPTAALHALRSAPTPDVAWAYHDFLLALNKLPSASPSASSSSPTPTPTPSPSSAAPPPPAAVESLFLAFADHPATASLALVGGPQSRTDARTGAVHKRRVLSVSPIEVAARTGFARTLTMLLAHGRDARTLSTPRLVRAFVDATRNRHIDVITALASSPDVRAINPLAAPPFAIGDHPLVVACELRATDAIDALLSTPDFVTPSALARGAAAALAAGDADTAATLAAAAPPADAAALMVDAALTGADPSLLASLVIPYMAAASLSPSPAQLAAVAATNNVAALTAALAIFAPRRSAAAPQFILSVQEDLDDDGTPSAARLADALIAAAHANAPDAIAILVASGHFDPAADDGLALAVAAAAGHADAVAALLAAPLPPSPAARSHAALWFAAKHGHTAVLDLLLAHPDTDVRASARLERPPNASRHAPPPSTTVFNFSASTTARLFSRSSSARPIHATLAAANAAATDDDMGVDRVRRSALDAASPAAVPLLEAWLAAHPLPSPHA